jgi:type IV secretory pathway ATPase VirB11/archaellum biosynthesis ATPase
MTAMMPILKILKNTATNVVIGETGSGKTIELFAKLTP